MQIDGYEFNLDKGQKGQLFDLRPQTIESFLAETELEFGAPVKRGTNPERQVLLADDNDFLGVAVFTQASEKGLYEDTDVVSVLTQGAIFVESSVNGVTAGEKAYITDEGLYTNVESTNLEIGEFLTSGEENELVVLKIK